MIVKTPKSQHICNVDSPYTQTKTNWNMHEDKYMNAAKQKLGTAHCRWPWLHKHMHRRAKTSQGALEVLFAAGVGSST